MGVCAPLLVHALLAALAICSSPARLSCFAVPVHTVACFAVPPAAALHCYPPSSLYTRAPNNLLRIPDPLEILWSLQSPPSQRASGQQSRIGWGRRQVRQHNSVQWSFAFRSRRVGVCCESECTVCCPPRGGIQR